MDINERELNFQHLVGIIYKVHQELSANAKKE